MSTEICDHCGQKIRNAHKEVLNKHKLIMLKTMAKTILANGKNEFDLRSEMDRYNYNNFQKLRYHGLIAHVTKDGVKQAGRWLITRNGWAFLRGQLNLPKWVLVLDNHVQDKSGHLINVKDVYRGAETIDTTFAYFSATTGDYIGHRPMPSRARQAVLL